VVALSSTRFLETVCGLAARTKPAGSRVRRCGRVGRRALTGETIKPRRVWRGPRNPELPVFGDDEARLGVGRGRRRSAGLSSGCRNQRQTSRPADERAPVAPASTCRPSTMTPGANGTSSKWFESVARPRWSGSSVSWHRGCSLRPRRISPRRSWRRFLDSRRGQASCRPSLESECGQAVEPAHPEPRIGPGELDVLRHRRRAAPPLSGGHARGHADGGRPLRRGRARTSCPAPIRSTTAPTASRA